MYYQEDEQCTNQEVYESLMGMPAPPPPMLHTTSYVPHHPPSPPPSATTVPDNHPSYMMPNPTCWYMGPMGSPTTTTRFSPHQEMMDPVSPSFYGPPLSLSLQYHFQQDSFYTSMASSPTDVPSPMNDPLYHNSSQSVFDPLSTPTTNHLDDHHHGFFYASSSSSSSSVSPMTSPHSDALLLVQHQHQHRSPIPTITSRSNTVIASVPDNNDRSFQCPICSRGFKRKHDLQRHVRVHTGDKPYSCLCCKKAFARTDALKRHLRMEEACRTSPVIQAMKYAGKRRYRNL